MSINACDINVSMLLSLLLPNIRILSIFFLFFLVILNNSLIIPADREKIKVKPALPIPTGASTIPVNEQIDTPPAVALKTIKILSI